MRLHSANNRWSSKEPWLYRKESELVISNFMRYRHRLVPYIHSAAEPLIQPMYWDFPDKDIAYSVPNQYFFSGTVYDAGEIEMFRTLGEIPVLAREGSIVPLDVNPSNGCLRPDEFEVLVVVGKDGRFELVEEEKSFTVT